MVVAVVGVGVVVNAVADFLLAVVLFVEFIEVVFSAAMDLRCRLGGWVGGVLPFGSCIECECRRGTEDVVGLVAVRNANSVSTATSPVLLVFLRLLAGSSAIVGICDDGLRRLGAAIEPLPAPLGDCGPHAVGLVSRVGAALWFRSRQPRWAIWLAEMASSVSLTEEGTKLELVKLGSDPNWMSNGRRERGLVGTWRNKGMEGSWPVVGWRWLT